MASCGAQQQAQEEEIPTLEELEDQTRIFKVVVDEGVHQQDVLPSEGDWCAHPPFWARRTVIRDSQDQGLAGKLVYGLMSCAI